MLLGEIPGDSATLGWVSGTSATLRNTGTRLNNEGFLGAPAGLQAPVLDAPRDELFAMIEDAAARGSWPVDSSGGFSSSHPISSNFLFCDGSVRPLKNTIDERVYRLLGNRHDGEPISSDAY
jgi:prepilin-type processing-associated H-X9-DG protein